MISFFGLGANGSRPRATFRSYSSPLTIRPNSGTALVLRPPAEVVLRPGGFGSPRMLPHIYLPVVMRDAR